MKKFLSIPLVTALVLCGLNTVSANNPSNDDIVIITKDGIQPARSGKLPKNSNGTLFLRSAV